MSHLEADVKFTAVVLLLAVLALVFGGWLIAEPPIPLGPDILAMSPKVFPTDSVRVHHCQLCAPADDARLSNDDVFADGEYGRIGRQSERSSGAQYQPHSAAEFLHHCYACLENRSPGDRFHRAGAGSDPAAATLGLASIVCTAERHEQQDIEPGTAIS